MEKATFAAGCFWGVEAEFRNIDGVVDAAVGYTGGTTVNPSYRDVCTGATGHAEAVELTFDPARVSYDRLLDAFWEIHDPTTPNRQGPDVGTQYRSAIFYHSAEQQSAAQRSLERVIQSRRFRKPVVSQITPASAFYKAEDYHQRYLQKQGLASCKL